MNFDPITGNEVQIGGFTHAIHAGDIVEDAIERIILKIENVYEKETAHKIVRLSYQRGACTFFCNAGNEEQMYNKIRDYLQKQIDKEYYPLVFNGLSFVSYSPLEVVESDNES